MKTLILSIAFVISFSGLYLKADNGRTILEKAFQTYNQECPIQFDFTMSTRNIGENETHSQKGEAWMAGEKFKIDIPEAAIWYDGTTQWVLVKDANEVNINNPDNTELTVFNPRLLFKLHENGYQSKLIGQTENNGNLVEEVILVPIDESEENIGKVRLQIDAKTNRIKQIVINKDDMENTITINKYGTDKDQNEKIYRFQESEYPDVEIVDLR